MQERRYLSAVILAFVPLVLLDRTKEQLYLLALSVAGLLITAYLALLRRRSSSAVWTIPAGNVAALAIIHVVILFTLSNFSSIPMVSHWFAWIVGSLPLGYLIGRLISVNADDFAYMWKYLAALAVIAAAWGCIQYLLGFSDRASGPFLDFNSYGALLYLFLIPAFAALLDPNLSKLKRVMFMGGLVIGMFAIFATYSRAAIGITLLTTAVASAAIKRAGTPIFKPAVRVIGASLLCYAAVKLAAAVPISRTLSLASDPSFLFRIMMWKSAWHAWLDHPLLGTGLGTYPLQYQHYRLPVETNTTGSFAHNDYLQMLMEGGPLLLFFLVGWGVISLWLFFRLWRTAGNVTRAPEERLQAAKTASLVLAVIGLFIHAAVNFIFYVGSLSLVAGLYLARAHVVASAAGSLSLRLPARRALIGPAFVGLSVLAVGALLIDWTAGQTLDPPAPDSFLSLSSRPIEERYRAATLVSTLRPANVLAQQTLCISATDIALAHRDSPLGEEWSQRALGYVKTWLAVSQGNAYAYQVAGQLLWNFPALRSKMPPLADRPDALLLEAIDRYPAQPDGYRILARFWISQGRSDQALRTLGSALPWAGIPITTQSTGDSWLALIADGRRLGNQLGKADDAPPDLQAIASAFDRFEFPAR